MCLGLFAITASSYSTAFYESSSDYRIFPVVVVIQSTIAYTWIVSAKNVSTFTGLDKFYYGFGSVCGGITCLIVSDFVKKLVEKWVPW